MGLLYSSIIFIKNNPKSFHCWIGTGFLRSANDNNILQRFHRWNGTIRRHACRRRPRRTGALRGRRPSSRPGRGGEGGQRGKTSSVFPLWTSLFPHGACFVGGFTAQWMKGRVVVIQVVRATLKTLSYMNFAAVGAVFFVSVTGYVTAILETEFRSAR